MATGLIALAPRAAAGQDPCSQLQSLLPGSPADVENDPPFKGQPGRSCIGYYWLRVAQKSKIGGLHEFGAMVSIRQEASPAAAKKMIIAGGGKPVAYGDGGFETLEGRGANDLPTPTDEEAKQGAISSSFGELLGERGPADGSYYARFTCGAYVVYVSANPSKGDAARQLVAEMDANRNLCGAAAVAVVAPPIAPPVTVTPPTDVENRGGTRYFDGETAKAIQRARAGGSRYMVVLSRTWDASQNCFLEERAWVSSVSASSAGTVGAVVGPSRTVCVKGGVLDQARVNQAEEQLRNFRLQLVTALKKRAEYEPYLKDAKFKAWATTEIAKIDTYIAAYERYIAQTEAILLASIPR